jgi:two-component system sensor histidine kinase/response regulator
VGRFYKPAEGTAAASAPTPAPAGDGLPAIDGLNAADGLARVGGNRQLYLKLLRQFVDQQGPSVAQIAEALVKRDGAAAERLAHSLKGVAANLGATAVQAAAGTLERLIRDRASDGDVEAARQRVGGILAPLVDAMRAALGPAAGAAPASSPAAAPVDPAAARDAARRLSALLSDADPAAADFIDANRAVLSSLFDATSWAEFESLVQGYAFAEAQARLERALDTLAGSR